MPINNIPLPQDNQSVKEYDTTQTVEINKLPLILQTILAKLNIIDDFIIERGSNHRGSWEKWASGKMEQEGIINENIVTGTAFGALFYTGKTYVINYPIPFLNDNTTYATVFTDGFTWASNTGIYADRIHVQILSARNTDRVSKITWRAIGTWK